MSNGETQAVLAGEFSEASEAKVQTICRRCGSNRVYRLYREGFLQEKVYPIFGYYPWKCKDCGQHLLIRKRRKEHSGHHKKDEHAD